MPNNPVKFLSGYLIPSLNEERFGSRLMWLDKDKEIFQMDWCHKATQKWTERAAAVFVEWDKTKGHYQPQDKSYFTKSKQRFRSLLNKFINQGRIIQLISDDKLKKVFQIGDKKIMRKTSSENKSYEEMICHHDISEFMEMDNIYRKEVSKMSRNALEDHDYVVPVNCLVDTKSDKENMELMDFTQNIPKHVLYPTAKYPNNVFVIMNCESNLLQSSMADNPKFVPASNVIAADIKNDVKCAYVNTQVELQDRFPTYKPAAPSQNNDANKMSSISVNNTIDFQDLESNISWSNFDWALAKDSLLDDMESIFEGC